MKKYSFICCLEAVFLLHCCIFQPCHSYQCKVRPVDGGVYRDWLIESTTGNHTISAICECNTFSSSKTEPFWRQLTQTTGGSYKSVPKAYTDYEEEQNTTTLMNYTVTESTVLMCGDNNQNYAKAISINIIEECSMTNNGTKLANSTTTSNTTSKWSPGDSFEDTCTSTTIITATHTLTITQIITSATVRVVTETQTQQTSRPTDVNSLSGNEDTSIYVGVSISAVVLVAVLVVVLVAIGYKLKKRKHSVQEITGAYTITNEATTDRGTVTIVTDTNYNEYSGDPTPP